MLDEQGAKEYWQKDIEKGGNHYHNKWQDAYAFHVRTNIFKKSDFFGLKTVVDVGCGVGDYMSALAQKAPDTIFIGFDFPFNIEIAKKKYLGFKNLEFKDQPLPSPEVDQAINNADGVVTTTVYVHLASEARRAFLDAIRKMRKGARVMLLEYAPDVVPGFQKNLPHKIVETSSEIITKLSRQGFRHLETRPVNYIDSFLFFHLGKNSVTYYLTLFLEKLLKLVHYPKSKYKLLIFQKQ